MEPELIGSLLSRLDKISDAQAASATASAAMHAANLEKFGSLTDKIDKLDKRLYGNGQPGVLHYLNAKIEAVDAKADGLKSKMVWGSGIITGAGAVIGFTGKLLLTKLGWMK